MELTNDTVELIDDIMGRMRRRLSYLDNEEVHDVKHDTICALLELDEEPEPDLAGYIAQSITNNAKRYIQKKHNRRRLEAENVDEIAKNVSPTVAAAKDRGDPESIVEAEQELARRFQSLSPLIQKILTLVYAKGMSVPRVAQEIGTTEAAIYKAMQRGRQTLQGTNDE